ncbi:MAG: DUF2232 domain-containing protein [bacterium]|nr:DUF2232 domain-containing protein [bacterium]MDD5353895.1 DUF2232 domain-containing protein [bacterium]MDD5756799.1 DUF2232 domain-containing protein [bacterium]
MAYSYRLLTVLILASIVLFWPPLTFLALIPLVLLYCLKGTRYAVGGMVFAALAIWLLSGINFISLIFLLVAGIPALAMGILIKKDTKVWPVIILSTTLLLGCLVLLIVILEQVGQLNFSLEMQQILRDSLDKAYQFYKNRGVGPEELSLIKRNSWRILGILELIWPSLLAISIWFAVYIDYLIVSKLLRRLGITVRSLPALRQWQCPDWLVWGVIVPSGLLVSDKILKVAQQYWLYSGLLSILVVVGFAYFIQGLSIANYYFHKAKAGKLPQVLFYFLVALNRDLWFVMALFGLLDFWINFRKINKTVAIS